MIISTMFLTSCHPLLPVLCLQFQDSVAPSSEDRDEPFHQARPQQVIHYACAVAHSSTWGILLDLVTVPQPSLEFCAAAGLL